MDIFLMQMIEQGAIDATWSVVQSMPMNTRWFRDSGKLLQDCAVSWCSPVLWIKP